MVDKGKTHIAGSVVVWGDDGPPSGYGPVAEWLAKAAPQDVVEVGDLGKGTFHVVQKGPPREIQPERKVPYRVLAAPRTVDPDTYVDDPKGMYVIPVVLGSPDVRGGTSDIDADTSDDLFVTPIPNEFIVYVNGRELAISDPGSQEVFAYFVTRLAEHEGTLEGKAVDRAIAIIGDAIPDEDDTAAEALGPFYTTRSLTLRWDVSKQAINQRVKRGTLLALPASDGSVLYPAFQFIDPDRPRPTGTLPSLRTIIATLSSGGAEPTMVAAWLRAHDPRLGGTTAEEWLRSGQDPTTVERIAKQDSTRWMQ